MPYAKLIINPAAGGGRTAKKWPRVVELLEAGGLPFDYEVTTAPEHARQLACSAARAGYQLVVSVGGDGTINEVVNGLHDSGELSRVTLGIVDTGSGSDIIRTLGIPRDYRQSCIRILNPNKISLDLGIAECTCDGAPVKRLFVNLAALGLGAEVVKARSLKFKAWGRTASYLLAYLGTFLSYRNGKVALSVDGHSIVASICVIVVSNGKYAGGGMLLAPDANPGDGLLNVMTVGDLSKLELLRWLPKVYRGGHLAHPMVSTARAKEVVVSPLGPMSVQVDGEFLGQAPAEFHVLPAALAVLV